MDKRKVTGLELYLKTEEIVRTS